MISWSKYCVAYSDVHAEECGDAGGTGYAAESEEAVEPRHHRPPAGPFDDDRLDVQRPNLTGIPLMVLQRARIAL